MLYGAVLANYKIIWAPNRILQLNLRELGSTIAPRWPAKHLLSVFILFSDVQFCFHVTRVSFLCFLNSHPEFFVVFDLCAAKHPAETQSEEKYKKGCESKMLDV